jgi:uncharacterized protein (DUF2345 family)
LRTDAYGAIRAGKGILISTYYGSAPGGSPEPAAENSPGIALLKQAQGFADTFNRATATHQTVQFILVKGGAHNGEESQSRLDDERTPIAAMLKAISGVVDAQNGTSDGQGKKIPHMHAPLVVVTAQAGLGVAASDGLHIAAGEVAHFASGRDMNIAVGEALTMHSGQALGLLAGAVGAGEGNTGIKLYAGQGDIDMQAQSDTMTFAAKELVKLISANSHIDFAAAKSITLCTEGGASLTMEGGNITFACPGTISIKAASKSFTGPTSNGYGLPRFPKTAFDPKPLKFKIRLQDLPGPESAALAHTSWEILRLAGGSTKDRVIAKGETDANGNVNLTAMQEKKLAVAYARNPNDIWISYPGQVRRLDVTTAQEDWSEADKAVQALAAMDYADLPPAFGSGEARDAASLAIQDFSVTSVKKLFGQIKK